MSPTGWVFPVSMGILGAAIGSFLNVVVYRLPRPGMSVLLPRRSFCPSCKAGIAWWDNLPIVSFLVLRGRCRHCRSAISVRYVVVEALAALFFGALTHRFATERWSSSVTSYGELLQLLLCLTAELYLVSMTLVVTFIDFEHKIIPDAVTLPGILFGLLVSLVAPNLHEDSRFYQVLLQWDWSSPLCGFVASLTGMLAGGILVALVGFVGTKAFRQEAMGMGDVKYLAMAGAFVSLDGVLMVFFLGCILGALFGLVHRVMTGQRSIPFGPYLSVGILLVLFWRTPVIEFFRQDWPRFVRQVLGLS